MGINVQPRGDKFQLRVKHDLLQKPFFHTFDTDTEARSYGSAMYACLQRGVVPAELLSDAKRGKDDPLLSALMMSYVRSAPHVTRSDADLLTGMSQRFQTERVSTVTYPWVEKYVASMKANDNYKPGTIRKRVEALGRVFHWHLVRTTPEGKQTPANPFRMLPKGYSGYTDADTNAAQRNGGDAQFDAHRDMRLAPGQEELILVALDGHKRDDRERALEADDEFKTLFMLIVDLGLRLREAYTLRVEWVSPKSLQVQCSKQERGEVVMRHLPMRTKRVSEALMKLRGNRKSGVLFSYWNGEWDWAEMNKLSNRLSKRFITLFDYAGVPDFKEHDLRHEATCRWVLERRADGAWSYAESEICKFMGWSRPDMLQRYLSLRSDDYADRLNW